MGYGIHNWSGNVMWPATGGDDVGRSPSNNYSGGTGTAKEQKPPKRQNDDVDPQPGQKSNRPWVGINPWRFLQPRPIAAI